MLVLEEWPLIIVCLIVMLSLVAIVRLLMRPLVMQRERERDCAHDFKTYQHDVEGRTVFHIFFCHKCGARRTHALDVQVGTVATTGRKAKKGKA